MLIHALPIFHVHGLFVASHGALLAGARMLWLARFDADAASSSCCRDATVFMGVPTLYVRLLAEPALTREACRNMRLFISGSAPLLLDTFEAFRERTGHTILERYGMSETVMLTSNPYDRADGERRGGTVGFPLPGVGVRVVDDDGAPLPPGTVGAIEVRGPNVFAGYWRMPEKTREEFTADGWFRPATSAASTTDGYSDDRRPQQGPHHQRRLQRLPGRGRGRPQRAARRRRERRRRRAAPRLRRGGRRRRRAARPARRSTPAR